MPREPREQHVRDLLKDKWQNDHPFGLTPKISYGWFDADQGQPQVTIRQPDEGPVDGGRTGYSGIDPTGGGPTQTISGVVEVHVWARYSDLKSSSSATTDFPRKYITGEADTSTGTVSGGVLEEIYRIVRNNPTAANPKTGNQPMRVIAAGDATKAPEPDEEGLEHYVVPIRYVYGTA